MKTTKLHVGSVQVQIEKCKNDARVVQTHVDLKNIKWAGLQSPTEVKPLDLSWRVSSNQAVVSHFSLFLANALSKSIIFCTFFLYE